jgi:hypothetical protein
MSPAFWQCSLQYFPYGPSFDTVQLQPGCAHFAGSAMAHLRAGRVHDLCQVTG